MGPDERKLRAAFRRKVNAVPIPQDMWANISRRLDQAPPSGRAARSGNGTRPDWWRGGFALAAAVGIFWLSVIPTGQPAEHAFSAVQGAQMRPAATAQATDPDTLMEPRSGPASRGRRAASYIFVAQDAKPRFNLPIQ